MCRQRLFFTLWFLFILPIIHIALWNSLIFLENEIYLFPTFMFKGVLSAYVCAGSYSAYKSQREHWIP